MFFWTLHLRGEDLRNHAAVAVGYEVYCFTTSAKDQLCVHVFNTVTLRWRTLPPVTTGTGERNHTAVLIEHTVYLWGGCHIYRDAWHNILHAFDVDTNRWFRPRASGTVPEGRWGHSACVLGKDMFIHGGKNQLTGRTKAMHKLDTSTMVWSLINTRGTPPPSIYHSATIIGTKMFVYGGYGKVGFNDINRVFDTETNCWLRTTARSLPEGRWGHSAFTYNGELYIVGGCNRNLSDLWKFNPETFSWKRVRPKGKRHFKMYMMCCCMVGDSVLFFGGPNTPSDLYMLDLSPSLKMLCKLAVIQHGLDQSGLPHNIRCHELPAMSTNSN